MAVATCSEGGSTIERDRTGIQANAQHSTPNAELNADRSFGEVRYLSIGVRTSALVLMLCSTGGLPATQNVSAIVVLC
jgi:hypothetical protein